MNPSNNGGSRRFNQLVGAAKQQQINLADQPKLVCANCGNDWFVQAFGTVDLSPFVSPTGKRQPGAFFIGFVCPVCMTKDSYVREADYSNEEGAVNTPINFKE